MNQVNMREYISESGKDESRKYEVNMSDSGKDESGKYEVNISDSGRMNQVNMR